MATKKARTVDAMRRQHDEILSMLKDAEDYSLEEVRMDLTPRRPSRTLALPEVEDITRHRQRRPRSDHVPQMDLYRVGGVSPTSKRQVVYELPRVKLSFDDFESSLFFKGDTVHNTDVFSPVFAAIYDKEMANLQGTYLGASRNGYKGPRNLPVVFEKGESHCVSKQTVNAVETELEESDPYLVLTRLLQTPPGATSRALESTAMTLMAQDLPRTDRSLRLFHWVTDSPGTWTRAKSGDSYSCIQWLDTHSHPAWFWPKAKPIGNRFVLLKVSVPRGTAALRAQKYNSHKMHLNYLKEGQWAHTHSSANDEEIRLPPGEYTVSTENRKEMFAGHDVLLVNLKYTRLDVGVC